MKKQLISLIAILIGMAFLPSCEQSGTSGTSTTTAAATGSSAGRNQPKTRGSATEMPSPIPGGSTAPGPGR